MPLHQREYTYDFEIETMVTVFLNALSDIVIKRFEGATRTAKDHIKPRLVYAPKQRVLADLLDKDQNLQLPVTAVYIGGISRDVTRVFNKITGTYVPIITPGEDRGKVRKEGSPQPVDITFNVTVVTRYQSDMDQILSHILPYVNPYFVVSWRTPSRPSQEIRSNVHWGGSVNIAYPYDIGPNTPAKVVADLSFVFKGWIFQSPDNTPVGIIHHIDSSYNATASGIPTEYLLEARTFRTTDTDEWYIQGVPPHIKAIDPYFTYTEEWRQFNVYGSGLKDVSNVYLSGDPFFEQSATHNPFGEVPSVSAVYPPFDAYKLPLDMWKYDKDSFVTFVLPAVTEVGNVDLIIENTAGYSTLTAGVRINDYNPFPPDSTRAGEFVPYQVPYLDGIEVRQNPN